MATYYKPVLNYELSFDCNKGEKNKMDVYSTCTVRTGRNKQVKFVKKTAEVCVCESTNVDETIWTVNKFERELEIISMSQIQVQITLQRKMDSSLYFYCKSTYLYKSSRDF